MEASYVAQEPLTAVWSLLGRVCRLAGSSTLCGGFKPAPVLPKTFTFSAAASQVVALLIAASDFHARFWSVTVVSRHFNSSLKVLAVSLVSWFD